MNSSNPQEYITLRGIVYSIFHTQTKQIDKFNVLLCYSNRRLDYRENYSSYYERRSRNKDECSHKEYDQYIDSSLPSGLTYFSKVRIDVHSLQVIIDDFTFAHTTGRRQQSFGSAGDCFSSTKRCPRGSFSINFETTKFRIRPKTHWETRGLNAIQHFYGVSIQYNESSAIFSFFLH